MEAQDVTDFSLTTFPKLKISSETLPTNYGEYSKVNTKYHLFIASYSQEELERFCFCAIGQWVTFCLNKDYKTSHCGSSYIEVKMDEGCYKMSAK